MSIAHPARSLNSWGSLANWREAVILSPMSDIQTCLATFAVAAWVDSADAKPMAIDAIEAYVANGPEDPQSAVKRLKALHDAYGDLRLDSALAIEIAAAIDRRMNQIAGDVPKPDRP